MNLLISGPFSGQDLRALLGDERIPRGYPGAPLTAILASELIALGHTVTALTTDARLPVDGGFESIQRGALRFMVCPSRPRAWRFSGAHCGRAWDGFALERRQLTNAIRAVNPELIHAHWSYEFALAALEVSTSTLITCHDSPSAVLRFSPGPYRAMRYLLARRVFARGQHFSVVSRYLADSLEALLPQVPAVVPNPVAESVLQRGRIRPRPKTRRVAMICNGWSSRKNPEPALRAFAQWRRFEKSAQLHLFGSDFGLGEAAQQWAQRHQMDIGVHFRGRMPHADLIAELDKMDALVHPALEESFGVVVAEAMGLGLPVVAGRDSGGVPEVLSDPGQPSVAGDLVDVRSGAAIEQGLVRVFGPGYEHASAEGVRRARQRFSPRAVALKYLDLYARVSGAGSVAASQGLQLERGPG